MPRARKITKAEDTEAPLEAEEINVKFTLPSGRTVWWPATVESIDLRGDSSEVLADAVVVYHAAFSYAAERGNVQVLRNRVLRAQVVSWKDAAWKYPDERVPAKEGSGTMDQPRTRGDDEGRVQHDDSDYNVNADDDVNINDEVADDFPSRAAKRRCTQARPVEYEYKDQGLADVEDRMMQRMEKFVESRMQTNAPTCNHAELVEERVRVERVKWTDELLRHCSTLPRPRSSEKEGFSHVLCAGCTTHKFKIDYNLFNYILEDIEKRVRPYGSVLFRPSEADMIGRTARLERHVIFRKAATFFEWLGVAKDMNRKAVLIEDRNDTKSGGAQMLRIMGSMRRNAADANSCMQLLVGRSSSHVRTARSNEEDPAVAAMEGLQTCGEGEVECIAYATGQWDEENSVLADAPTVGKGHTGPLSASCVDSTFSISWQALSPLSRGKYSVTPHFAEGVQLGHVIVRYPYILVRGRTACDEVRHALRSLALDEVL